MIPTETPITQALRDKENIARMGCEDIFQQCEKFERLINQLQEQLKCLTPSLEP